jgi:hypothetical protein
MVTSSLGMDRIQFFRLGEEANLPAWYSASQLLLVALVFALIAWRDARWTSPRTWGAAAPALFLLLLSLDEGGMVHERVGWWLESRSDIGEDLITGPWLYVVVPVYAVLAFFVARAALPYVRGRRRIIGLGVAGCVLFVAAAAGFEGLGNFTAPESTFARQVLGVFEEVGEMVAATTLLWVAVELVRAEGIRLVAGASSRATASGDLASGDGALTRTPEAHSRMPGPGPRVAAWGETGA